MTITLNGTTGITTDTGYSGDGVTFADGTPSNTLVTNTSGNVGIGTSSPTGRFSVTAAASQEYGAFDAPTSGYAFLRLRYNGTSYGNIGQGNAVVTGGAATDMGINTTTNMLFATNGTTERMRIDSSGNLLVGTTSTAPRDFTSGSGCAIKPASNGSYEFATSDGNCIFVNYTGTASGSANLLFFRQQGNLRGTVSTNGSTVAYNTSSDYRLKDNVVPMTGALATVSQLKPVTYTWKESGTNGQGFIAHELQAVVPDCVTGEKDAVDEDGNPIYQGIDTSFLVATLTAAIQEQQAIITAQASAITALEARLTALENK